MLSKCQNQTFQNDLSHDNQLIAKTNFPKSIEVLENEAYHLFEDFNFEESIRLFFKGCKKLPKRFKFGVAKVCFTQYLKQKTFYIKL